MDRREEKGEGEGERKRGAHRKDIWDFDSPRSRYTAFWGELRPLPRRGGWDGGFCGLLWFGGCKVSRLSGNGNRAVVVGGVVQQRRRSLIDEGRDGQVPRIPLRHLEGNGLV